MEAVILAAGLSSRAGGYKMLLPIDNKPVIERVIEVFQTFCDTIYVVTGFETERIEPVLSTYPKVELVYNENFLEGMFSSVQTGVSRVKGDRCFMCPGDYPILHEEVLKTMINSWENLVNTGNTPQVLIPSYQMKSGHPILMSQPVMVAILKADRQATLREVIGKYRKTYVNVNHKGILEDLDTPEDYEKFIKTEQ